jgi:hypothetical protein
VCEVEATPDLYIRVCVDGNEARKGDTRKENLQELKVQRGSRLDCEANEETKRHYFFSLLNMLAWIAD